MNVWIQFGIAALLIVLAGFKLITYGDALSKRFKLGHAFVGAVLIGWCTSLPELVLSIGTAHYVKAPEIAMGNIFGSNMFNLLIIVILDIYYWRAPILRTVGPQVKLSAWLSLIMVTLGMAAVVLSPRLTHFTIPFLNMGYDAGGIFIFYMICMLILYKFENAPEPEEKRDGAKKEMPLGMLLAKCFVVMAVIVIVGLWLSQIADQIAKIYQLEKGFVGTFFLAIVSSLPEVITCIAAVRLGFHAMALGTLFGSNIFNIAIICFCDVFYRPANIFAAVADKSRATSCSSLTSGISIFLMTVIVLLALRMKREKKGSFMGFESVLIAILYLGALFLSYKAVILVPYIGRFFGSG